VAPSRLSRAGGYALVNGPLQGASLRIATGLAFPTVGRFPKWSWEAMGKQISGRRGDGLGQVTIPLARIFAISDSRGQGWKCKKHRPRSPIA
jgi:hypothetical protein